jgi:hypothetical protein
MGVATSQARSKSHFQRSQISATGLVMGGDLGKLTRSPRWSNGPTPMARARRSHPEPDPATATCGHRGCGRTAAPLKFASSDERGMAP